MKISVEMSLYPLADGYMSSIEQFIADLNTYDHLDIKTNALSTQVSGEFDAVMHATQVCLKKAFESGPTFSLVSKILNVDATQSEYYD